MSKIGKFWKSLGLGSSPQDDKYVPPPSLADYGVYGPPTRGQYQKAARAYNQFHSDMTGEGKYRARQMTKKAK